MVTPVYVLKNCLVPLLSPEHCLPSLVQRFLYRLWYS